jgi:tetratricopeptide (TPR) repeat protein
MRDFCRVSRIALKLCFLFLTYYLAVCVSAAAACSAAYEHSPHANLTIQEKDIETLYQKALDLFNAGDYKKSIEVSKSIIEFYDRAGAMNLPAESPYELSLLLIADCEARLGNPDAAQDAISTLVSAIEKGIVPRETLAKAELKSANIYLEFQNYDVSLRRFQQVLLDFPDSPFSQYAAEKMQEITAFKTGEARGLAKLRGAAGFNEITVTVFNGFGSVSASTGPDGSYTLPVYRSTGGTYLVLIATKEGYTPRVETVAITESGKCSAEEIELGPLEDANCGVLTGVCYKTIQGGKLRPAFGINSFVPNVDIVLAAGESRFSAKSNNNGVFMITLPPGTYRLLEPSGRESEEIKVKAGHTSVFHIGFPGIRID